MSADNIIAVRPRHYEWRPGQPCACTALILTYLPDERTGHVLHGALICVRVAEPDPDTECHGCGAPMDATPKHTHCPLCRTGLEDR